MGDRTYCNLFIWGSTTPDLLERVYQEIQDEGPEDWSEQHFSFNEMNYGIMPDGIKKALHKAGLSYIWDHDAGAEYGQGTEMRDAETDSSSELLRSADDLVVTVRESENPELMERIRFWQTFRDVAHDQTLEVEKC